MPRCRILKEPILTTCRYIHALKGLTLICAKSQAKRIFVPFAFFDVKLNKGWAEAQPLSERFARLRVKPAMTDYYTFVSNVPVRLISSFTVTVWGLSSEESLHWRKTQYWAAVAERVT